MRAAFPSNSPMVGLNCACAIFMLEFYDTEGTRRLQTLAAPLFGLLDDNLSSIPLARFLRNQAGNSLPSAQLAAKQHTQLRKRFPELTGLEEVRRIPRAAGKLQLRARESLHQQDAIRPKRAHHLREQRSLQVLNAND